MIQRKQFDLRKFIDREFEKELFEELLAFEDAARILAIHDASGMGKSHLLKFFHHRCRTGRPRTPVSLIDLKQLPDQSPMMFVKEVQHDLTNRGVPFPAFNRYESARVSVDFEVFRASIYLQGTEPFAMRNQSRNQLVAFLVNLHVFSDDTQRHALLRHAELDRFIHALTPNLATGVYVAKLLQTLETAGGRTYLQPLFAAVVTCAHLAGEPLNSFNHLQQTYLSIERAVPPPLEYPPTPKLDREFTPEQREKAEDVCVRSFLDDVCAYCATQPVVLLIDSFEQCGDRLHAWLRDHLLEHYFFDQAKRPARLLLVIAGQHLPEFENNWAPEDCTQTVKSVVELGRWTREHVEQCLIVHGLPYEEKDIDAFHRLIERGIPPSQVVQWIEGMVEQGRVV